VIHLDTSILVDALTGPRRSSRELRRLIEQGERLGVSSQVLYEWLRGPRQPAELASQESLFPSEAAVAFGPAEARRAAELYRIVRGARGREVDLAIAACALVHGAAIWTLNAADFGDIPELSVHRPPA
jgi:predicted nucleic acid-binding protein